MIPLWMVIAGVIVLGVVGVLLAVVIGNKKEGNQSQKG